MVSALQPFGCWEQLVEMATPTSWVFPRSLVSGVCCVKDILNS